MSYISELKTLSSQDFKSYMDKNISNPDFIAAISTDVEVSLPILVKNKYVPQRIEETILSKKKRR